MRIHNLVSDSYPFLVHAPGPKENTTKYLEQNPLWLPIKSATFQIPAMGAIGPKILTFRTANEPSVFEKSLSRLGLKCSVLGIGVTDWTNIKKLALAAQALDSIQDEFVLISDSKDVLLLHWPHDAIERFSSFQAEAVFNAESIFWPDIQSLAAIKNMQSSESPCPYLNAGVVFGRTKFLKNYYHHLAKIDVRSVRPDGNMTHMEIMQSEQVRHMLAYNQFKNQIAIDCNCRMFQNIVFQNWNTIEICRSMV